MFWNFGLETFYTILYNFIYPSKIRHLLAKKRHLRGQIRHLFFSFQLPNKEFSYKLILGYRILHTKSQNKL